MTATSLAGPAAHARPADIRVDLLLIADMVAPSCRVLDIGCGEGELLEYLAREKRVDGRGIELSQAGVNACVSRGLSVVQGDADTDLRDYPTGSFDYAILSQTLQATRKPDQVLRQLLRIGKRAIVSFPNFGYWKVRLSMLWHGRMPVTSALDQPWYDTPNIHLCTIRDFALLCDALGITVEKRIAVDRFGQKGIVGSSGLLANLLAEQGVFLLSKKR
ncbi:MAG TPA: methionine biosynthesis protein MetW [Candidatus Cybelea sp.]|nr:methionine biosynthesis protein MetW [Candidatus Cybelea sp.]